VIILERGSLYGERVFGYETPSEESCNIDTAADWERAETLFRERAGNATR
jgi:CMP-N-acetylneuraminic acid synthetase